MEREKLKYESQVSGMTTLVLQPSMRPCACLDLLCVEGTPPLLDFGLDHKTCFGQWYVSRSDSLSVGFEPKP